MPNPHDALFCQVFADPRHAEGEIRAVLPPAIAQRVSWSTLRLLPATDKDVLRGDRHADLLFEVLIDGEPCLLHLLLEHKSGDDRFTAVQVGDYAFRIFRRHLREQPDATSLPPILAVVVFHGPGGWRRGDDLESCFRLAPETKRLLAPYLPGIRFFVDDLSSIGPEELASRTLSALARLVLEVLRRASAGDDLRSLLRALDAEFRAARAASGDAGLLAAVLTYLGRIRDLPRAEMQTLVRLELGSDLEEIMYSTYDQTIDEGRTLGLAAALQTVLVSRFGPLDADIVRRIEAASIADLEKWLERVAAVPTPAAVFDS